MRTKIVRIGNSQGVRIPKEVLADAGLLDDAGAPVEVDMTVKNDSIVIRPATNLTLGESFLAFAQDFRRETGGVDLNKYIPPRALEEKPNPFQRVIDKDDEEVDGGDNPK
jgi:antitoxin component of MazEF toxin-antitoxin module